MRASTMKTKSVTFRKTCLSWRSANSTKDAEIKPAELSMMNCQHQYFGIEAKVWSFEGQAWHKLQCCP